MKENYYYIYLTTNKINGKTYIGQHYGPFDDSYLGSGVTLLLRAIPKYGKENFYKQILAVAPNREILNLLEIEYIKLYREIGKAEYNNDNGGKAGNHSEECMNRIKASLSRRYNSPEGLITKQKLREANLGRKASKETRELLKKRNKEYWSSPEGLAMRKYLSEKQKGVPHSKEWIEKISKSLTGKKHPEDRVKKNSERVKKLWENEEFRNKEIESHKKLKWWNNGITQVHAEECPEGFVCGRLESDNQYTPKGRHYYNNGEIEIMAFECPSNFVPGRCPAAKKKISEKQKGMTISEEQKKQISQKLKGRHYYNNGIIEIRAYECPPDFVSGRIPKDRHLSEEAKEKIRQKRATQVFSKESVEKRIESIKKHNATPEGKATRKRVGQILAEINKKNKGLYHYYNNGVETIKAKECPDGYVPGMLSRNK